MVTSQYRFDDQRRDICKVAVALRRFCFVTPTRPRSLPLSLSLSVIDVASNQTSIDAVTSPPPPPTTQRDDVFVVGVEHTRSAPR